MFQVSSDQDLSKGFGIHILSRHLKIFQCAVAECKEVCYTELELFEHLVAKHADKQQKVHTIIKTVKKKSLVLENNIFILGNLVENFLDS